MKGPASEFSVLCFGAFELDPSRGELRRSGIPVKLQAQPLKVLTLLVSHAGQTVTRGEIRQQVWGESTFVDFEHGLNTCIRQIRVALGEKADVPVFIETVPRRGYRFIASIRERTAVTGGREPEPAALPRRVDVAVLVPLLIVFVLLVAWAFWGGSMGPSTAQGRVSVAVLPFENFGGDPGEEYFSDGLTEEIATRLGEISTERLGVVARTSTQPYKRSSKGLIQIGKELGVQYVLEGSARKSDHRVRVSVQLIQVSDQTSLWAANYDREMADVISIQQDIASNIVRSLAMEFLTPTERARAGRNTRNPAAYEAYLKGRYFWHKRTPEAVKEGIRFFREAVRADPGYAVAYVGLADSYNILGDYGWLAPSAAYSKAKNAANQALALNPDLAEAHAALGKVAHLYDWDWRSAERSFHKAIALNPNYSPAHQWYGELLVSLGEYDKAAGEMQAAGELDPLSLIASTNLGWMHYFAHRYDAAIRQYQTTLAMDPTFRGARLKLGLAYVQTGMYDEALGEFQRTGFLAGLGYAYARAGEKKRAQKILEELRRVSKAEYEAPYNLALVHVGLGDSDQAIAELKKGYEQHGSMMAYLAVDPAVDSLRTDPRFEQLLLRMNLRSTFRTNKPRQPEADPGTRHAAN